MLLMLPMTCKGLAGMNLLLLMCISALYSLMYMLAVNPLRYINTLWLASKTFEVWLMWYRMTVSSYTSTLHGKILANRKPFAKIFLTNIHR